MCASEGHHVPNTADDVWADSSSAGSEHEVEGTEQAAGPHRDTQLDREWEARKQQFHNAGFREGLEEGKELTLQQGFNAGFAEGAQAGYEFGLVKSTLQLLAAHLADGDSRLAKVQELLQQVSALSNRAVMVDTCTALLSRQPADVISDHLQAALTLHGGDDDTDTPCQTTGSSASAAASAQVASAATQGSDAPSNSSSSPAQAELPLPLQLVAHLKQELQQLGFSVGSAPELTVASSSAAHTLAPDQQDGSD